MPTKTFDNLPVVKKEKITSIAIDEFSEYGYKNASINNIVKRAGIAKGSMYQYFPNKKDLYQYIVELVISKKLEYMKNIRSTLEGNNFFQRLKELCVLDIKFSRDNPRLEKVFLHVLQSDDLALQKEMMEKISFASESFIKELFHEGLVQGEFRENVDMDLVVFTITNLFVNLSNAIIQQGEPNIVDQDILKIADQLIDLLKHGLHK